MEWLLGSWSVILSISISIIALLLSWLSYLNSKRTRMLSNQPKFEINHVFDEGLQTAGYLLVSIKNLNGQPFQAEKVEIENLNLKTEYGNGEFSKGRAKEKNKENSFIVYIYMNHDRSLNNKMIITYRDFEGKKRKMRSEPIKVESGKLDNRMNGSKFILV